MDEPRTNYWNEPVGDLTVRFRVRTAVLTVSWCLGVLVSRLFRESSCCSPALLREKETRRLLPGQPGGDDERLSCEMFVCLPQPCNTCCTFEDAFPSPLNLEMLEATLPFFFFFFFFFSPLFRVSQYPRNHIICRASAPFAAAGHELHFFSSSFSFFLSGAMTQDVPVSSLYFFKLIYL